MNPHDCNNHKILSLARLPVPTLPHIFDFLSLISRDFDIISNEIKYVNTYFYFLHIFYEPQLSFYSSNEFKRTKRFGHIIIAPNVNPVILSVSSSFAINMIMGYVCFSRIFWQRENPLISGSIISRIARSSSSYSIQVRASFAELNLYTM